VFKQLIVSNFCFVSKMIVFQHGINKNTVPILSDKELQGICVVCMLSMAASTVQVLSRAADTIMLCALDEMAYDGHKIRHASESLKTQIHGYVGGCDAWCLYFFFVTLSGTTVNTHARITLGVGVVTSVYFLMFMDHYNLL